MGFAFSQTQNLSQQANTRSGIIPIKWGFVSDVDNMDINMRTDGSVKTSALMFIGETGGTACHGDFGDTSVESGNNETTNTITQTEANWRTLEINPNAKNIEFFVITRAGEGGNSEQYNTFANCTNAGNGLEDCCDAGAAPGECGYCLCACNGLSCPGPDQQCSGGNPGCSSTYFCCDGAGGDGGSGGYYKVNIDIQNHNQESLWIYLTQFNGNSGANLFDSDCNDTIKVELYRSTHPYNHPDGMPDMGAGGLYVDFKAYPGEKGNRVLTGVRSSCGHPSSGCGSCFGGGCNACPGDVPDGDDSYFDTPYVNPSLNGNITISVITSNALEFWGGAGNNGLLSSEFGWDPSSNNVNSGFVQSNFNGTGGTGCVGDFLTNPDPSADPPELGECGCLGETFDTDPSTSTRTSGQLVAFVVR